MKTCTNCRISEWRCPRCDTPICPDHLAIEREECVDCALAYYDSLDTLHLNMWFAAGALVPWASYAALYSRLPDWSARSGGFRALTTGFPALDILIMVAFTSFWCGKAMMGLRKWNHRRSFVTRELARAKLVRH